jgi:hypothetical protein
MGKSALHIVTTAAIIGLVGSFYFSHHTHLRCDSITALHTCEFSTQAVPIMPLLLSVALLHALQTGQLNRLLIFLEKLVEKYERK